MNNNILGYEKVGYGKEIIFLFHDWMCDSRNYRLIKEFIDKNKFTYYFIDLRGYGKSKKHDALYSLDTAIEDIRNIVMNNNLANITLVGHSMSSFIVQKFYQKYFHLSSKLILVTPISPSGIKIKDDKKQFLLSKAEKSCNELIKEVMDTSNKLYSNNYKNLRVNDALESSYFEAKYEYMKMYLNEDFSHNINIKDEKILIILGKYDLPAFQKSFIKKEFEKFYNNIDIVQLESSHYPMLETPIAFVSAIESVIKESKY